MKVGGLLRGGSLMLSLKYATLYVSQGKAN